MSGRIAEEKLPGEPTYIISLEHLPLTEKVRLLKDRGYGRVERREMIESVDKISELFPLSHEEGFRYQQMEDRRRAKARDQDDDFWAPFNKFMLVASPLSGIVASVYTGQLRWTAIGAVAGVAVPLFLQTIRDVGYSLERENDSGDSMPF